MFSACCARDTALAETRTEEGELLLSMGEVLRKAPTTDHPDQLFQYQGAGPWSVSDPRACAEPRMARSGVAGPDTPAMTMMQLLKKAAGEKGDRPALLVERVGGTTPPLVDKKVTPALAREDWTQWTYQQYHTDVRRAAKAFVKLGLGMYESVNVWGFNAPEWHTSAIASMFAGGKCAGLYPTDTAETAAYKVVHSQGRIVVAEDRQKIERLAKALSTRGDCRGIRAFVAYGFSPEPKEVVQIAGQPSVPLIGWEDLLKLGDESGLDAEIDKRTAEVKPGNCAALIYTSGTTGLPKAVMISHDNIIFESSAVMNMLAKSCKYAQDADSEERILSYLPLSHVAGMMVDIVCPVYVTAMAPSSASVFFARPYDLKEKAIKDRLNACKPTVFLGVPLVWEKIADQIRSLGAQASAVQSKVAAWAKGLSLEHAYNIQLGGDGAKPWGYSAAESIVLKKIKGRLGLDECKYGFTGAAPIRVDTLEFFGSLGLHINELYGMSECGGATTVSCDQAHQWGSCGWQMRGTEIRAFKVDGRDLNKKTACPPAPDLTSTEEEFQGELCFRGRHIMMGYLASPDMGAEHEAEIRKKNAETIDSEGWLHSGDKGMITAQGMVKITGRYKEIIIGEGGENIAPVPIEDQVKKACDGICEVMMVGDKRKYNIALITLKAVGANGEVPGTDDLDAGAKRVNPAVQTISGAMDDKIWIDAVTAAVTAANTNGKVCPNNAFKIQKFCILPTNFSEEMDELTPTKKLKRKVVETRFAKLIDRIYEAEGSYIRFSE